MEKQVTKQHAKWHVEYMSKMLDATESCDTEIGKTLDFSKTHRQESSTPYLCVFVQCHVIVNNCKNIQVRQQTPVFTQREQDNKINSRLVISNTLHE